MYLVRCEPIFIVKELDLIFFLHRPRQMLSHLLMVSKGGKKPQKQARKTVDMTAICVL